MYKGGYMKKVLSVCCIVLSASSVSATSVQKVVYCAQSEPDMLQVGSLELYFTQQISCEAIKSDSNTSHATLQVPLSVVVVKPSDMATLNEIKGAGYQVAVQSKNKQYELVITYDPQRVLITCAPTLSIDMQHGLVIRFFDQIVLHKMRSQDKPVLCVACL